MQYFLILVSFLALVFLIKFRFRPFNRHSHNKWKAKKVLKKIRAFEHPGQVFSYLRKIDPFVFEELLLTAFKNKGYKIIRNKKYTGDGGIDGRLIDTDGNLILIQAKRYSGHINKDHIIEFSEKIKLDRKANKGYFVHTGKTGASSYSAINDSNEIQLISGNKLIDLILL